ncbi:MAG: GGDEF domain-containing protein [Acidimicrobiia bacterium]
MKISILAAGAAAASLGFGIAAAFVSYLGIAAGICGVAAGCCAVVAARSAQRARQEVTAAQGALAAARLSFDETLAMAHEEANRHRLATETLVGAPPIEEEVDANLDMVFDPATGLLDERFFAVIVQQRVAAARRQLQPLSIVLFEIDGFSEASEGVRADALTALGDVIRKTLRECDSACRIGDLMAAAILEDTTEAGAVWAAERVRSALAHSASGRGITLSAGVACYPSHALGAPELVAMAGKALESARSRGRDHVEIAPTE